MAEKGVSLIKQKVTGPEKSQIVSYEKIVGKVVFMGHQTPRHARPLFQSVVSLAGVLLLSPLT